MSPNELCRYLEQDRSLRAEFAAVLAGAALGEDEGLWVWANIRVKRAILGLALEVIGLEPQRVLLAISPEETQLRQLFGPQIWLPRFGTPEWSAEHGIAPLPEQDAHRSAWDLELPAQAA